jgi:subtilisin-like proprotein convertase family protein
MFLSDSSTDLPADGTTTGRIGVSNKVYGLISQHTDSDWYRTYLVAGVTYTLTMDADNLDSNLVLRDADGKSITADTGLADFYPAKITYTPTASGYYFLDAQAAGNIKSAGNYTLELKSSQADDYTATTETTATLALGQAGAGNIELAGDADWLRVVLNAGQTYSIDLGGNLGAAGQLRVMSGGGHTQFVVGTGHVTFTPAYGGIYFVEVSDPTTQKTGAYSVTVTAQPSMSVADAYLAEGDSGAHNMSFVITLPSAAASAVSLKVDTADETAVAGQDYQAVHTSVTIPAGATSVTVNVPILGNTVFAPNRTFALNVAATGDAAGQRARGYIVDDDAPASLNLPSDPLLGNQWYLYTVRAEQAWALATGKGVKVAVFDSGIDSSNTDLRDNINLGLGRNGFTLAQGGEPVHVYDFHGTMVAGVIGAARNGAGLVGVAYDAQLVSIYQGFDANTRVTLINGFTYAKNVDVMNNSWGYDSAFVDNAYDLHSNFFKPIFQALQDAATQGRGGLGTIIVQSAGNSAADGDDANLHNFTNSRYVIAVGATDYYGHAASYSTPGACILVCAPGGGGNEDGNSIFTTDRPGAAGFFNGDTGYIDGTSFAAPVVSGVVALMLQANPGLGLRDVQQILAYTARQVDVGKGEWDINGANDWNGGGLHYNGQAQVAGFGQVDALGAVRLAASWDATPQTVANTQEVDLSKFLYLPIPDNDSLGLSNTITVSDAIMVERVDVTVLVTHPFIGDLTIVLTSPTGTRSVLMSHPDQSAQSPKGSAIGDVAFNFNTVLDWGESGTGNWILTLVDSQAQDVGSLDAWELNIVGKAVAPNRSFVYTDEYPAMVAAAPARGVLSDVGGGKDTLNAAALSGDSRIDLSGVGATLLDGVKLTIATGTQVVKAISGAGNDTLIANNLGNTLRGMGGNDTLVGGGGTDTAVYGGSFKDYTLSLSSTNIAVTDTRAGAGDGADTLTSIERLQFSDGRLALDLGTTQSAGKALLLMAATLGAGFPADKGWAGSFLRYFDTGASLLDGAQLLVSANILPAFDGGTDNASFVRFVFGNVNGFAPDAATLAALVAPLDSHSATQAQWLASMASSSANQAHVNLAGYAQHGWEYLA